MHKNLTYKVREWLRRYIPAEILGTLLAVGSASLVYETTHSYLGATAAGLAGEGLGFYGYFIVTELYKNAKHYSGLSLVHRVWKTVVAATSNLLIEFAPAEVLDIVFIRPFLMYLIPHYIHPYALGFLVGKLGADIVFYVFAVLGYEARKRWLKR